MLETASRYEDIIDTTLQVFAGQIMGTSVGTHVFVKYGWRAAASLSVAWTGFCLLVMLARGPHCSRYTWFGYEGGFRVREQQPAVATPLDGPPTRHETSRASVGEKPALDIESSEAKVSEVKDIV